MTVHDRKGGWLRQAASLALGNRLPRVAGARRVEIDAIRPNAFRLGPRQWTKGPQRLPECGIHAIEDVYRRDAGSKVDAAVVHDVGGPDTNPAEILNGALINAGERVEPVDCRSAAFNRAEARALHRLQRNRLDRPDGRPVHRLQHDERVDARPLRNHL